MHLTSRNVQLHHLVFPCINQNEANSFYQLSSLATGKSFREYLKELRKFTEQTVHETALLEDLNPLLPKRDINFVKKQLIPELLSLLHEEIKRVEREQ